MIYQLPRVWIYLFIIFALSGSVWPEERPGPTSRIDWETGHLQLFFQIDFDDPDVSVLEGRQLSEIEIRGQLPFAIQEAVAPLQIDSYTRVEDNLKKDPLMLLSIEDLAKRSVPIKSHLSPRLDYYTSEYSLNLYPDIISFLPLHEIPQRMHGLLDWEATADYTGIVIYVKGDLPVWGTREEGAYVPSFFPKIFDENMNLVFSKEMMDPEVIKQTGMCSYVDSELDAVNNERTGHSPFTTMGMGLFGKYHTDIIISEKAARKITYTEHNRNLLTSGRILIICDLTGE